VCIQEQPIVFAKKKIDFLFYKSCGEDYCENYNPDYCINKSVYRSRNCYSRGCGTNLCVSLPFVQQEFVTECELDCNDGKCVGCVTDSDCPSSTYQAPYCSGSNRNDLYHDLISYSCINNECEVDTSNETIKECGSNYCGNYLSNYCKGNDVYQNRTCNEKGCSVDKCYNHTVIEEKLTEKCDTNEVCFKGECKKTECSKNSNCDDGKSHTLDRCDINNSIGKCNNLIINCTRDSDCGKNSFFGDNFCSSTNASVLRWSKEYRCENPGTTNSSCRNINSSRVLFSCGESYFSDSYCKNENVYSNFVNISCLGLGICNTKPSSKLKEVCDLGCNKGECKECINNSNCQHKNYFGNYSASFCKENLLYQKRDAHNFTCSGYKCVEKITVEEKFVQECGENEICYTFNSASVCKLPCDGQCSNNQICENEICEDILPFNILLPINGGAYSSKRVLFNINVSSEIKSIKYIDEPRSSLKRVLCNRFRNNLCNTKKYFTKGEHKVNILLTNKSGFVYDEEINFRIN